MTRGASPLAADAIAGITDPVLAKIVGDHWEYLMWWAPTYATTLGDHRYDDRMARRDAGSRVEAQRQRDALIDRLVALDPTSLEPTDRDTALLLRGQLEAARGTDILRSDEWNIDAYTASPLAELSYLIESHGVKAANDAHNLLARMTQGEVLIDDTIANLRTGLADGLVAAAEKVRRAILQLDAELAKPRETWTLVTPAWATEYPELAAELRAIVDGKLAPALIRLRDFYRDMILPKARGEHEGLYGLPGEHLYEAAILFHVGLPLTPRFLNELGHAEIARTDRELAELGARVLGTPDLASTIRKLRDDPALYFTTREQILEAAQTALDRAKAAIPGYFRVLPKTDCIMRETPAYEAPYSTVAYYRQPHYDGSKPGEYFVNTYKPETRARFEMEALTWHESIPGHHLQIAIAQELGALPAFRKLDGSTSYVEGWALYTERLADEMGLYTSDLDRLGKLSFDAWRAARLVVDTSIHANGWSREVAEAYMREHTALTEINISNEVDRYIGWPGQALAYKVGQIEILRLRALAEDQLAEKFELATFHEVVLGAGAVTLPVLAQRVQAWITSRS